MIIELKQQNILALRVRKHRKLIERNGKPKMKTI